ncbi:type 2C protein phosphatase PTC7 [Aspergillus glaucus CBS 516.65]|uniref:Protein phosphatase n=1 Tax=Aspergillus glaucus CBS 516.65 TaxID=1160497 RepID=A0A1L9VY66_ASPGL|nr:hypothetical protein ASPGLDRAFT_42438 [Aspergillus glaucus CBS 516.65]OJJ88842.1 hypothetical protein ASPGLDRAFT_42438 [Aspergillus glaucus CBS 516.65]
MILNSPSLARACCIASCSSLRAGARERLISAVSTSTSVPARRLRFFHSTHLRASNPASPARINYNVAVSSSGKGNRFHPVRNAFNFDSAAQDSLGLTIAEKNPYQRRKKRPDSGADAFFVSKIGHDQQTEKNTNGALAFAVADGVGGWEEHRVDPGDFSHGLCGYMAESALSWPSPADKLRPRQILEMGYDRVIDDQAIPAGASTAHVGVALPDGRVELANLGDSGSVLLRRAAVHHYTPSQTHGFNTPYQLSVIPQRMRAQAAIFGGAYLQDTPRDAAITNLHMQHGDVLMLATDGVFDNLNNQEILKIVNRQMILAGAWTGSAPDYSIKVSDDLEQLTKLGGLTHLLPAGAEGEDQRPAMEPYTLSSFLAASVAGNAKVASVDRRRDGPFAKEYQRYYPYDHYRGGKVDDICVLVVVAVEEGRQQQQQDDSF